jgi:hypothetical protein
LADGYWGVVLWHTQISANSAFSDLPEHLLVDIYRELLVQIGGFSASTTGALITQENKYGTP